MARKGKLQEIISKAIHADNPKLYTVVYRDFDEIREVGLLEFLDVSENFQAIPASRIIRVKKSGETLFKSLKYDMHF